MFRLIRFVPLVFVLLSLTPLAFGFGFPGSNDNIFPPAPAAKPFIDFDGRGFLVRGKRTFIVAGDMHYSRVPRALWRDRLLRVKRAGYNTVQTYTFWNFHETREGQFDFSGDKDLNAYLKLIQSLGMYAIVRVGPYVNAEWDSGGWPVWLRFKPGLVVRENNRPYLYYLDRWLDHLMPIVTANQINRGGPIIMVQLENEDTRGSGTDVPNPYFQHLKDRCVALGLQVPYFFSGLNHSDNPAGDAPFDITQRTSPWYSSEFWTGWIQFYGSDPNRTRDRIRATWNVLANGGAGYTHYTVAGGTDFDTWGCDAQAASYDFGAPIGQGGDLRPMYFGFKRAALFATSFPEILANAPDSTAKLQGVATGSGLGVYARTGPGGTIIFLKNDSGAGVKTQIKDSAGAFFPSAGPFTVEPHEMMPVVENAVIAPGITLSLSAARIWSVYDQGNETTVIIYGAPGDPAELHFTSARRPATLSDSPDITLISDGIIYKTSFTRVPHLSQFSAGNVVIRVLALPSDLADFTWLVKNPEVSSVIGKVGSYIVIGPAYVGEVGRRAGRLTLETETLAGGASVPAPAWLLPPNGPLQALTPTPRSQAAPATVRLPTLTDWRVVSGILPAQPTIDIAAWKVSDKPLAMGADGDPSAYAWYRTTVHAPTAGVYHLHFADAGDWLAAFVNGNAAGRTDVQQRFENPVPRNMDITLPTGDSTFAVLAAHGGREKLHAYIGSLDQIDAKGINGEVTLSGNAGMKTALTEWLWKRDDKATADATETAGLMTDTDVAAWSVAHIGDDVFHATPGFAWFTTTLPTIQGQHPTLHFGAVDDNATVYVNGKRLLHHEGWNEAFDVPLDGALNTNGPNRLTVLVENTSQGGGITQPVILQTAPSGGVPVTNWRMHGGITLPLESDPSWMALRPSAAPNQPSFYSATFVNTLPPLGAHPVLRVSPIGLSRGFMWLNGHSLGRYPERSPVDGLYLPECWMVKGRNTVTIFDEEGLTPAGVKIIAETVAGRTSAELTTRDAPAPAQ